MNTNYVRELDHNYLVIENIGENGSVSENYALRMLEANDVPGFLKLFVRSMNGDTKLCYEVTARMPLSRVFVRRAMSAADISVVLRGLQAVFEQADRHLLKSKDILLGPEYIFLDPDHRQIRVCYVPGHGENGEQFFYELSDFILKHLDHDDKKAVDLGYTFFDSISREHFSYSMFMESLTGRLETSAAEDQSGRADKAEVRDEIRTEIKGDHTEGKKHRGKREKEQYINEKKKIRGAKRELLILSGLIGGAAVLYAALVILLALDLSQSGALAVGMIAVFWLIYGLVNEKKNGQKSVWEDELEEMQEADDLEAEYLAALISEADGRETTGGPGGTEPGRGDWSHGALHGETHEEAPSKQLSPATRLLGSTDTLPRVMLISRDMDRCPDIRIESRNTLIGKQRDQVDVCIALDVMSRVHARLEIGDGCCYLEDLNSSNGTFLEGEQLSPFEKRKIEKSGQEVAFANVYFRLVFR